MLDLPRSEARHYDSAHGANAAVAGELFKKLKAPLGCACGRTLAGKLSLKAECPWSAPLSHVSLQSASKLRHDLLFPAWQCFISSPNWEALCQLTLAASAEGGLCGTASSPKCRSNYMSCQVGPWGQASARARAAAAKRLRLRRVCAR